MLKEKIFLIFLYCQPLIDILTSFQNHFTNSFITIGVICRLLFLLIILILLLKEKKDFKSYVYFIFYALYVFIFTLLIYQCKGKEVIFYELKNLFHIIYFPITLQCLKLLNLPQIKTKHFRYLYLIYLIFLAVPGITNTSFEGYKEGKTGIIGWFYATNEISAILSILMPFIFHYILKEKGDIKIKIAMTLLLLYAILNLGSKMPVLTFILLVIIYLFLFIRKWLKDKETKKLGILATVLILSITLASLIIPKTSIFYNIKLHLNFLGIHHIQDVIKNDQFLDHFIFSQRLTFLKNTNENYKKASLTEKLLGIGYIENYQKPNENRKTIEMDFFDIFYRTGIIGFLLFLYPLKDFLKEKRNKTYTLSLIIAFFIGIFVGHVFTSPAVSIFITTLVLNQKKESTTSQ